MGTSVSVKKSDSLTAFVAIIVLFNLVRIKTFGIVRPARFASCLRSVWGYFYPPPPCLGFFPDHRASSAFNMLVPFLHLGRGLGRSTRAWTKTGTTLVNQCVVKYCKLAWMKFKYLLCAEQSAWFWETSGKPWSRRTEESMLYKPSSWRMSTRELIQTVGRERETLRSESKFSLLASINSF